MTTTRIRDVLCPACGYAMTHTTAVEDGNAPQPGDCSLCLNCGAVNVFSDDLGVRSASEAEIAEFMSDENVRQTVQRAQSYIRRRGPLPEKVSRA